MQLPGTIALATRLGRSIPNSQDPDPPPQRVRVYVSHYRQRHPGAELRRLPTGQYNCHGMTFACRRTGIYGQETSRVVRQILQDDGYRKTRRSGVREGDVVVYREAGEITHTGIVTAVETDARLVGGGAAVKVVSKWGQGAEYVHYDPDCPYAEPGAEISFWTDRREVDEDGL